jgi:hypothetical protein
VLVGLGERHAGAHAMALRRNICLTDRSTLMRQAANHDGPGSKLRTPQLFNGNPEAGDDAKVEDHGCLRLVLGFCSLLY